MAEAAAHATRSTMPHSANHSDVHGVSGGAGVGQYRELFDASVADPEAFWADAARDVSWIREPVKVLEDADPPHYRWFPDAELNTCANALDRHVADGRADQPALIYDSPVTGRNAPTPTPNCSTRRAVRRRTRAGWVSARRPCRDVHADDPRGRHRHAGLRADRRGALGGVRGVCPARTGHPHRRRPARGRRVGLLRDRADAHGAVQADARRRARRRAHPPGTASSCSGIGCGAT